MTRTCDECASFDAHKWECLASDRVRMKPKTRAKKCREFVYAIHEFEVRYHIRFAETWKYPLGFLKSKRRDIRHLILTLHTLGYQTEVAQVLVENNVLPKLKYKQDTLRKIAAGESVKWIHEESAASLNELKYSPDMWFIRRLKKQARKKKGGMLYV